MGVKAKKRSDLLKRLKEFYKLYYKSRYIRNDTIVVALVFAMLFKRAEARWELMFPGGRYSIRNLDKLKEQIFINLLTSLSYCLWLLLKGRILEKMKKYIDCDPKFDFLINDRSDVVVSFAFYTKAGILAYQSNLDLAKAVYLPSTCFSKPGMLYFLETPYEKYEFKKLRRRSVRVVENLTNRFSNPLTFDKLCRYVANEKIDPFHPRFLLFGNAPCLMITPYLKCLLSAEKCGMTIKRPKVELTPRNSLSDEIRFPVKSRWLSELFLSRRYQNSLEISVTGSDTKWSSNIVCDKRALDIVWGVLRTLEKKNRVIIDVTPKDLRGDFFALRLRRDPEVVIQSSFFGDVVLLV